MVSLFPFLGWLPHAPQSSNHCQSHCRPTVCHLASILSFVFYFTLRNKFRMLVIQCSLEIAHILAKPFFSMIKWFGVVSWCFLFFFAFFFSFLVIYIYICILRVKSLMGTLLWAWQIANVLITYFQSVLKVGTVKLFETNVLFSGLVWQVCAR